MAANPQATTEADGAVSKELCPIDLCSRLLCAKWTTLIVRNLLAGPQRYAELQEGLGINTRILCQRLSMLAEFGIVEQPGGKRGPYRLTGKGEALKPIIDEMEAYGRAHLSSDDYC